MPRPSLVVFDLGGVLVRLPRSWADACRLAGLDRRGEADDPVDWSRREPLVVAYETGRLDRDGFSTALSAAMAGLYAPDEVARVLDAWLVEEFEGVGGVLDALDAHDVPTAILSNTNEDHWRAMFPPPGSPTRFPALRRVRHAVASHRIGARKPDAASYRSVERAAGASGDGVLFFDDLESNVQGARAHGWTAHRVDPHADPARQMLDVLARSGVGRPLRNSAGAGGV
jgi:glucose-1-phosphatase